MGLPIVKHVNRKHAKTKTEDAPPQSSFAALESQYLEKKAKLKTKGDRLEEEWWAYKSEYWQKRQQNSARAPPQDLSLWGELGMGLDIGARREWGWT
jgi:hypothetical protein